MALYRPDENELWISLDPGGTTGWALWRGADLVESGQIECGHTHEVQFLGCAEIVKIMRGNAIEFVLYEDFLLRGQVKSTAREGLSPVHVTAMLYGMVPLALPWSVRWEKQLASVAKPVMGDDRLRTKGLYVRGPHARDAVRHGVVYSRRAGFNV